LPPRMFADALPGRMLSMAGATSGGKEAVILR